MTFYAPYIERIRKAFDCATPEQLDEACELLQATQEEGGRVFLFGNGGSAAIASHIATDMMKVCGIRAVTHLDPSWLTMCANDYGFDQWMARTLEEYAGDGDMAIFISSSGMSANVLCGAQKAREMAMPIITLTGFDSKNALRQLGDVALWCNSTHYNTVEICHLIWLAACVNRMAAHG